MSSSSVDNDSGAEEDTGNGLKIQHTPGTLGFANGGTESGQRVLELPPINDALRPQQVGNGTHSHQFNREIEVASEDESLDDNPRRIGSPNDSLLSIPDDSPSVQGSMVSSPVGSSIIPFVASRPGHGTHTPSFRPFDRRFQSRLSTSSISLTRPSSPALPRNHSRNASLNSQSIPDSGTTDSPSPPWEVIRWTKLKKINGQAFSEVSKRNFGIPTCISVSACISLGTSKGIILIFDYHQNLKTIIGPGTKAVESGAITAIATSADHLVVAGGHANGNIFTWETARAARPFLHIPSLETSQMINRTLDGHVPNVAIRHLGFLGIRHTALVSADDRGMAFSHLATRGLGAVGRTVKTTRILGRYPLDTTIMGKPRKPSTVFAFAPLPLGNVEQGLDTLGLTAMLTPYLLVIVSTTPIAQTQHKVSRPKEIAAHSALSGCLAWFPAVKLKVPDPKTGRDVSRVKLVYCWSNILRVLDVEEIESPDKDKPSSLSFKSRSLWKTEEAIVAVQWLSRSVLTVLTITQRLIILEDGSMRVIEAFDLIQKHIYHQDLFSKQLHALVEQLDEEDSLMHGVVSDAFYMSFKAYKSRLFLLGFNELSIGTLTNWADRLISLMEDGDYIGAIHLATSYYTGDSDKLTIGLPEDVNLRHAVVQEKLLEIMMASMKFAFGQRQKQQAAVYDRNLQDLAEACIESCLSIGDFEFLFDSAYEWYQNRDAEGIFVEMLEPHILEERIIVVPPTVMKSMVTHFVSKGLESRLEEMICHMQTTTLDIDQITALCKQHNLYDALIYVWNRALRDYITPLVDLLSLLTPLVENGESRENINVMEDSICGVNALKMFPYISYTLTGRVYPTGEPLDEQEALNAKAELYWFLFSSKTITWPRSAKTPFLTQLLHAPEPAFPYLRIILKYDAPSFLSALNEAFEDSFLNDAPERAVNSGSSRDMSEEHVFGLSINRQYIITILLEVMSSQDFAPRDIIYLDMFIARNLPKFPQYLLLSGSTLHKVLLSLCNYPGQDLADDAQLSAEYLLSVYHPSDLASLLPSFEKAGFYRVLRSIYKSEKQYSKLLQIYFYDPDDSRSVFNCIADCLRPRSGLTKRQRRDVQEVIEGHAADLIHIDAATTAQTVDTYIPELHQKFLDAIPDEFYLQYIYLRTIVETKIQDEDTEPSHATDFVERYVQLMCKFDSSHVAAYVQTVQARDLRLEKVLPYIEISGVVDAAVVLMTRDGQLNEAMDRLIKHMRSLESAFLGLLRSWVDEFPSTSVAEGITDLLQALQKYSSVGIWLCQSQTKTSARSVNPVTNFTRKKSLSEPQLVPEEILWLDLLDATVQIAQRLSARLEDLAKSESGIDHEMIITQLRNLVQRIFTALLTSTSNPSTSNSNISFLRVLRAFLTRASKSSPNLSDLRAVLASVFSAYAYEETILSLANRLLEKDLFVNFKSATELRQRGWRPRGSTCEACGRRVWGPGISGDIFSKWEEREEQDLHRRLERRSRLAGSEDERGKGIAHFCKTSAPDMRAGIINGLPHHSADGSADPKPHDISPLVVLACRHIYHQSCLEKMNLLHNDDGVLDVSEFRCLIDRVSI